jgi:2-polyprenyl-3-methyl-5-hydroxy-6-metoxy-1,4-benzoquinol methylase
MSEHYGHALMPQATHDEYALERYLVDMRSHLVREFDPLDRRLCNEVIAPARARELGRPPRTAAEIREALEAHPFHQAWLTLQRLYQDMIWEAIGESVDRQHDALAAAAQGLGQPRGSLRLDPDFEVPRYISAFDHHRMAGSYHLETRPGDMRAGAMYDRYSSTYHEDRNGGWKNDGRGHTLATHVASLYPDLEVRRILDLGCAVGATTVALALDFPDAEVHAIDVGAPMLRYAHARAEAMGVAIHFSQQNAERTDFPDGHFDLVTSAVTLHETSLAATRNIFRECRRLLRPGGVMVHLEVPARYESLGLWEQVRADFESHYNNEPFMAGVSRADFAALCTEAGFRPDRVTVGFRDWTPRMERGHAGFRSEPEPGGGLGLGSWFVCSAVKE